MPLVPGAAAPSSMPTTQPKTLPTSVSMDNIDIKHLLDEQELKRRRLARKAELARLSRRKKKVRMGDLEAEVERLNQELENAQARASATTSRGENKQPVAHQPARSMLPSADDESLNVSVSAHQLAMAASNPAQAAHLPVLSNKLLSTLTMRSHTLDTLNDASAKLTASSVSVRFLEWLLSQPDKFYMDPSGLWNDTFRQHVSASEEQLQALLMLRVELMKQKQMEQGISARVQNLLASGLSSSLLEAHQQLGAVLSMQQKHQTQNLAALHSFFSPSQFARFFDFAERFGPVLIKVNL